MVQKSLIFIIVLDLFLFQFVLGRGYVWSILTGVDILVQRLLIFYFKVYFVPN